MISGRYIGSYSISSQFIDTGTGNIISSKNLKITATSLTEKGLLDSFVSAASRQISKVIE